MAEVLCDAPSMRADGSILGAARHRVRRVVIGGSLREAVRETAGNEMTITSAWVNHYSAGDFVAIHQDRSGADLTALLGLDPVCDPTVLCLDYRGLVGPALLAVANESPFPRGAAVHVEPRRFLFVRGAEVPHHRPPATTTYRVLAITVSAVPHA